MYTEDDYLMLSGIQHFYFCKRQWALIHIEQSWLENSHTVEGQILHEKTDNPFIKESRKEIFLSRSVPVSSAILGLSGIIDTIEFRKDEEGIRIPGKTGIWKPTIVEYKKGKQKKDDRDIIQLAAQTMCLEEKLNIKIETSDMFYFKTRQRKTVSIDESIRKEVLEMSQKMHEMYNQQYTPKAEFFKNCKECSLYELCMPRITKKRKSVENYLYNIEE